tara:strand:+ start:2041 stop:2286 length:246 start_codon:yes stop_codon:yes gene_type:complete
MAVGTWLKDTFKAKKKYKRPTKELARKQMKESQERAIQMSRDIVAAREKVQKHIDSYQDALNSENCKRKIPKNNLASNSSY